VGGGAEWRVVGNCVAPPGQNLPFVKVWKVGEGHVDQKATLPDENIEEGAPLLAYKLGGLGGGWRLVSPRDQKRVLRVFDPRSRWAGNRINRDGASASPVTKRKSRRWSWWRASRGGFYSHQVMPWARP
jgi:hypothetical protein